MDSLARATLIVNPKSTATTPDLVAAVELALGPGLHVSTRYTSAPGHASQLAAEAVGDDAVVVFGGDGTYNEVVNGAPPNVPLGFVPGGGTSVLPRALGVPRDPVDAARAIADAIVQRRTQRIAVGRVNGRRFCFSAGIGLDAEAVRRVDARGRSDEGKRPGDLAFAATVLRIFAEARLRFQPQLEIEGSGRAAFVLVANGSPYSFAGPIALQLVPDAKFDAGLSFVAPAAVRPAVVPRLAARALAGTLHEDAVVLTGNDLDVIRVVCDRPLPLQADGEDLGDVTEAAFEAERDAVAVLV